MTDQNNAIELRSRLSRLRELGLNLGKVWEVFSRQRGLWMTGEWSDKQYCRGVGEGINIISGYWSTICRVSEAATRCLDAMEGTAPKADEFTPAERSEWVKLKMVADAERAGRDRELASCRALHEDFLKELLPDVGAIDEILDRLGRVREVTWKDFLAWVDGKKNDKEHCRDIEMGFDEWRDSLADASREVRELGWSIENVVGMQPASLGGSGEELAKEGGS